MKTSKPLLACAVPCLVLAASSSPAQPASGAATRPPRVRVVLEGAYLAGAPQLADSRSYEEYAETASVRTTLDVDTGFAPSAAVQLRLFRQLGLLFSGSLATRGTEGRLQAQRPHPLYLSQPRAVDADLTGYEYEERALDFDLALTRAAGPLDWTLFAGPTLFQVRADLLTRPVYQESYPYDEVAVSATPSTRVETSPLGWNAGLRLDWRLARRFAAGATVRYSRARAELVAAPEATAAAFDAGGLQVSAGLRLLL